MKPYLLCPNCGSDDIMKRRLMLRQNLAATTAAYRVGYNDVSHFNREYKRLFGAPPMRDVERLREAAKGSSTRSNNWNAVSPFPNDDFVLLKVIEPLEVRDRGNGGNLAVYRRLNQPFKDTTLLINSSQECDSAARIR